MIDPPKRQEDYPDRNIDCEAALEPPFQDLFQAALAHGWGPKETRKALFRLLAANRRTDTENAKLEADLAVYRAISRASRR